MSDYRGHCPVHGPECWHECGSDEATAARRAARSAELARRVLDDDQGDDDGIDWGDDELELEEEELDEFDAWGEPAELEEAEEEAERERARRLNEGFGAFEETRRRGADRRAGEERRVAEYECQACGHGRCELRGRPGIGAQIVVCDKSSGGCGRMDRRMPVDQRSAVERRGVGVPVAGERPASFPPEAWGQRWELTSWGRTTLDKLPADERAELRASAAAREAGRDPSTSVDAIASEHAERLADAAHFGASLRRMSPRVARLRPAAIVAAIVAVGGGS